MHRGAALSARSVATLAALLLFIAASDADAGDPPGTFRYTVQAGDTCGNIAIKTYGEKRYDLMHRHNQLGPVPHVLKAGQVLILPQREREALVGHKVGPVRAAGPGKGWGDAYPGLDLYRRWRVNSMESGFAEVVFRDDSSVALRENTLLVIYGGSRTKARRERMRAELERGALRTRLGELAGEEDAPKEIEVATAGTSALLGSGSALVSVDDEGATRVANHSGAAAKVRARRGQGTGKEVRVRAGYGSKVTEGGKPTAPRKLPPSPTWSAQGSKQFAAVQSYGTILAQWSGVGKAAAYRVELSRDEHGRNLVMAAQVPASKQGIALRKVPIGVWYLAVIAIDADKFESARSKPLTTKVVAIVIDDPVDGPALAMPEHVWPATSIRVPKGGTCGTPEIEASEKLTLVRAGEHAVRCTLADGSELDPFLIVVRNTELSIKPMGPTGALRHNERNPVRLRGTADLLPHITVKSDQAATWPPRVDGEDLIVDVLPHRDAPAQIVLTAHVAGGDRPLAQWTVDIADDAEAAPVARNLPQLWAGLRGGRFVVSPDIGIDGGVIDSFVAPAVGIRWMATERFMLQSELHGGVVGLGPKDQGPIAASLAWSLGVGWLGAERPVRPLFELGAGQYSFIGHKAARLNAFYGTVRAGLLAGPGPAFRLTINQDLLSSPSAGFATATGVTAGISFEY